MNSEQRPATIRIFLADGTPDGLRIVEKSNWTGKCLVCSRAQFGDVKKRPDFSNTGVYILIGPEDESGLPMIYIGEGDPVLPRLESHSKAKDFWTWLIVFVSKDENLNKAHVSYLESRLVYLAQEAKRSVLDNANVPQPPSLSEPDEADMEAFLEEMLLIYPLLGLTAFKKPNVTRLKKQILVVRGKGAEGQGYDSAEGFIVLKGSTAVKEMAPSTHSYSSLYRMLETRKALIDKGVLADAGAFYEFCQDYAFSSPTMAAAMILGRNANGRTAWKDKDGRTLKEIQGDAPEVEDGVKH